MSSWKTRRTTRSSRGPPTGITSWSRTSRISQVNHLFRHANASVPIKKEASLRRARKDETRGLLLGSSRESLTPYSTPPLLPRAVRLDSKQGQTWTAAFENLKRNMNYHNFSKLRAGDERHPVELKEVKPPPTRRFHKAPCPCVFLVVVFFLLRLTQAPCIPVALVCRLYKQGITFGPSPTFGAGGATS